jgi:uncharacterized protein
MKLTLHSAPGIFSVHSYAPGAIRIQGDTFTRSLIITPGRLLTDWPPQRLAELEAAHVAALAELEAEVVLIGTGATLQFPPAAVLAPLTGRGVGVEIMDTAAACRTYNVLVSEDRRVAAALIIA